MPASQSDRRRALERQITNAAKERGTTAARLRRLVGFAVLCETLSEAVSRGVIPVFFVKVLLLVQRIEIDDAVVWTACGRVFAERASHAWPITSFVFPEAWHGILTELAREVRYDTDDASAIEQRFNSYLAILAESGS